MSLQEASSGVQSSVITAAVAIVCLTVVTVMAIMNGCSETTILVIVGAIAGLGGYSVGAAHIFWRARKVLTGPPADKKEGV